MTSKRDKSRLSEEEREREDIKGGNSSWPDGDTETSGEGELQSGRGRRRLPDDELDFETDQSWGSE